jgi:hypothetical protein
LLGASGGGGGGGNTSSSIPSHPNSSTSPYLFKQASSVKRDTISNYNNNNNSNNNNNNTNTITTTYKILDDTSQRNLFSRSLTLRDDLGNNNSATNNGPGYNNSINRIKINSSNQQKRNSASFNSGPGAGVTGNYGYASSRVDPLTNLFIRNNLDATTSGSNLNSMVRKNSLKLSREKSMATDYYTFMSTGGSGGQTLVDSSSLALRGSHHNSGSFLKNGGGGNSPVVENRASLSFDNVFSNLNLIYPTSTTPTLKNPASTSLGGGLDNKPNTGNKSNSGNNNTLKKQPSQSQPLLSSKLTVNRNDVMPRSNNHIDLFAPICCNAHSPLSIN